MYINRKGLQFSRGDTFDYSTLGEVMIAWLEKFKEHGKHGCPFDYLSEGGEGGSHTDEEIEAGIQTMYKEIDDLIWALDDSNSPDLLDLPFEQWLPMQRKYEYERMEKLKLFPKLYQLLWR
jgi:hypothetical protein